MYRSTTKGDVVKRSDCILVYESTTKGDVKRSHSILVYGSTTKGDGVKRSDCILVYGSTTKGDVVKRSDCTTNTYVHAHVHIVRLTYLIHRWIYIVWNVSSTGH